MTWRFGVGPPRLIADAEDIPQIGSQRAHLEEALVKRGVAPATATERAVAYPADRIQAKLEAFDWLLAKKDKHVARSPSAYRVQSIRQNHAPPIDLKTPG